MKKAWTENGIIREIAQGDPADLYAAPIAAFFNTDVPDDAAPGWFLEGGEWIAPPAPEVGEPGEPAPAPASERRLLLTPAEFRNSFSAFEEVAIVDFAAGADAETDAQTKTIRRVVGVFFDRLKDPHLSTVDLADPRNLAGLDLLVGAGILTAARREALAQGLPA